MKKIDKVAIIGLGYIGLPTAAVVASHGVKVIGVDINKKAVTIINQGKIHIIEPELDAVVDSVVHKGLLFAQTEPESSDYFIITVPTPFKGDHEPDLAYVEAAAKSIAPCLQKGNTVILESTSPVGTTEELSKWLASYREDLRFPHAFDDPDVFLAYCPERVLPGKILEELVNNDRVIGGVTDKCAQKAKEFYSLFVKGECIITNARTAEMCKLTENSFRDVNIAFANELSILANKFNINVWELINLANRHPRVNILNPGAGVGGHCIAVDPWFIVAAARDEAQLIKSARQVNDYKSQWVVAEIKRSMGDLACELGKTKESLSVACMGIAFKPDIDDCRESPALSIVRQLHDDGVNLLVVEPNLMSSDEFSLVDYNEAVDRADVIVLLVAHRQFKDLDWQGKRVLDFCGVIR